MVKKSSIKLVPFYRGSMVEWTHYAVGELPAADSGRFSPDEWRENKPFHRLLTYDSNIRGYSSLKFHWKDVDGHDFAMFPGSISALLRRAVISDGTCNGPWVIVKKGANYGVELYEGEMPNDEEG